ncbi:MAG: helix-turn-helix domain-containing protein [Sneathiella sp.]
MKWQDLNSEPCSVARTLSVIGERWTVLILRECFRNVARFDGFEASLGIPRAILALRLKSMVEVGILEKTQDLTHAGRFNYVLTEKGWDLRPVILTMLVWGDKHMAAGAPPMLIKHKPCNHIITPVLHCPECETTILNTEIKVVRNRDLEHQKT